MRWNGKSNHHSDASGIPSHNEKGMPRRKWRYGHWDRTGSESGKHCEDTRSGDSFGKANASLVENYNAHYDEE